MYEPKNPHTTTVDGQIAPTTPTTRRLPAWATDPATWTGTGLATLGLLLTAGLLWLAWLLVRLLGQIIGAIFGGIGHGLMWTIHTPVVRTVTDPVHAYITGHAGTLPASAAALQTLWVVAAIALFILGSGGSWSARIGFTIHGAITTAMVWAATPDGGRHLAVATTAILWCLTACIVYARAFVPRGGHTIVIHQPAPETD